MEVSLSNRNVSGSVGVPNKTSTSGIGGKNSNGTRSPLLALWPGFCARWANWPPFQNSNPLQPPALPCVSNCFKKRGDQRLAEIVNLNLVQHRSLDVWTEETHQNVAFLLLLSFSLHEISWRKWDVNKTHTFNWTGVDSFKYLNIYEISPSTRCLYICLSHLLLFRSSALFWLTLLITTFIASFQTKLGHWKFSLHICEWLGHVCMCMAWPFLQILVSLSPWTTGHTNRCHNSKWSALDSFKISNSSMKNIEISNFSTKNIKISNPSTH